MIDYLDVIRTESRRFGECGRRGDLQAPVPACPGWSLSDLLWHLAEVQHYWGSIVGDLLDDPAGVVEMVRPADAELTGLFDDRSARLLDALARHSPDARCWTWDDRGWTVGWVRRRQAHEALIHRIDAEQTVGEVTGVDEELAADGVHEVLHTMVDGMPDWATFTPDGSGVTVAIDGGAHYGLHFGRFRGTGPESGTAYDFDAATLGDPIGSVVSGSAAALDLWLWGRGGDGVRCDDPEALARTRAIVADATK